MTDAALQSQLDDFDPAVRRQALSALLKRGPPAAPTREPLHVNLHCHTLFSYNGYGASPSRVAWEARQQGWYAAGICDFDVLDGLPEFFEATDRLAVRATANVETRVFFREYAAHVLNSPGEPGVYYFMGAGFVQPPAPGSSAAAQLDRLRAGAAQRNRELVAKVNTHLAPVQLDYDHEVLPLTPAGNATERHICTAYYEAAKRHWAEPAARTKFWSDKLGAATDAIAKVLDNPMDFNDLIRAKLMKQGGPGYVAPDPQSFPLLDNVIRLVRDCQAVPMATWLDGTSTGEASITELLECQIAKGIAALNIIPDRNWNIKDPETRRLKIAKLEACVATADRLGLPVNVGTELNKYGQPWVDDFTAEPMRRVAPSFIRGARIMVGHTRLLRFAAYSYSGAAAKAEVPDLTRRNAFFEAVGTLPPPDARTLAQLRTSAPSANLDRLRNAARRGRW